ncbi:MAG: hypothetical protein HY740_02185 [Chloroflexi bacterium]|nr:hypothetical protein [Chloroflexota bacterium]
MWRTNFTEYVLLLGILFFRLQNLTAMPLFWDEGYHVNNARQIIFGESYFGAMSVARWFNTVLLALFQPLGVETPWLIRASTVLFTLVSVASCVAIGRWVATRVAAGRLGFVLPRFQSPQLNGKLIGLLALFFYGIMPFAFFYDRQAMSDPIMAMFGSLGIVFLIRPLNPKDLLNSIFDGLCFALAVLTKFAGILYAPLPLLAAILFYKKNRNAIRDVTVTYSVFTFLLGFVFAIASREIGSPFGSSSDWCHSPQCQGQFNFSQSAQLVLNNTRLYFESVQYFYTYPLWLLAIVGALANRKTLFLSIPAFLLGIPYIFIADLFPPRYLTFTLVPISVLASFGLIKLMGWMAHAIKGSIKAHSFLNGVAVTVVAVPALWGTFQLVRFPSFADYLPPFERVQYSLGWGGTLARLSIVNDLLPEQRAKGKTIHLLVTPSRHLPFYASWNEMDLYDESSSQQGKVMAWLLNDDPIYIAQDLPIYPLPQNPHGLIIERVKTYADPFEGKPLVDLWRVTGTTDEVTQRLSRAIFGDPQGLAKEYEAASSWITGESPVWAYPPHQASMLRGRVSVYPVANSYPVNFDLVESQLSQRIPQNDLWVMLWNETKGDPTRRVERWLDQKVFLAEEKWFGALRVLHYYVGVSSPTPLNVVYGDVAKLESVSISASPVRVELHWRALNTTQASYKIFAHVLDAQGQLVTQRDNIPQNGFAPTDTWKRDQIIVDRFALPQNLSSGIYIIKVGLYDPLTNERVLTADNFDSIEISRFTIP